ncbi:DNA polymerase III subunit alpha [Candidatus Hodgkinia cicadicola]|nr:DNA polymerase III subunit alpha [Candidatus Hodgkinia cicadicola]
MKSEVFANLKVHSVYSILESALSLERIAELTLKHSQRSVCLTDNNLHGALEFCVKCRSVNIQPIVALKVLIDDQHALFNALTKPSIATLIVRTERGYANLLKLINASAPELGHRVITLAQLEAYAEGLTLLLGEVGGLAWEVYRQFEADAITARLDLLRQIVNNNLCFELQRRSFVNQQFETTLTAYAETHSLLVVATNETFFEAPQDYSVYKALCVVSRTQRSGVTSQNYFKSYAEMLTRFADVPRALNNCGRLCNACEFYLETRPLTLPAFLSSQTLENSVLYKRLIISLERLFYSVGKLNKRAYYKRLIEELRVVSRTRYAGYFLMVMDFVLWAKTNNILVGPGRGSAAGSLLAYCANITNVDPLQYGLLFERFLNAARANPPDIDVDFCHVAREELIRYVQARYTAANVAQISTFGVLQLRGAIKDAGRCLQIKFETLNNVCAALPTHPRVKVTNSMLLACCAKALIPQHIAIELIATAEKLVGVYRHVGTHAAGVVISNSPLADQVPVVWDSQNKINVTQYNMGWIDAAGLPKFDLLGLKTLTVVGGVLELLAINRIEPNINFKDEKTYSFISRGLLLATFQLESEGITKHVKHMKPSSLNDLAALIALYRPGPIQQIKLYSDIKHGRAKRAKIHSKIDSVLDDTYGIIVYQEQVMLIAQALSGYSLVEADELRKAMAKKNKSEMLAHTKRFIDGAAANGVDKQLAAGVFETLVRFADYGFNKSHAVAYAMLAYTTAYLKCNFTLEFYAVCLTVETNEANEITDLYYEALELEVEFAQPSVQAPYNEFKIINSVIQFPLSAIKNVPQTAISSIAASKTNKPFASLTDFCCKCDSNLITENVLRSLILGGAFDCFQLSRAKMVSNLKLIQDCIKFKTDISLIALDYCEPELATLYSEYCLIGCFVSENPIDRFTCECQSCFELAVVVAQTKTTLTLVLRTHRLEVSTDIDYPLQLGQVYACEVVYIRSKPVCKRLYRA